MDDYFALLNLPRRLGIDLEDLGRRFRQRSRLVHPDVHARSGAAAQAQALDETARLNEAYRILKDPFRRTRHLLALEGITAEGQPPATLLAEVFEVQELLEDPVAAREALGEALATWQGRWQELLSDLEASFERWDAGDRAALNQMVTLLAARRYLENLRQALAERAEA